MKIAKKWTELSLVELLIFLKFNKLNPTSLFKKIERLWGAPFFIGIYQIPNGTKNLCTYHKLLNKSLKTNQLYYLKT
jgi:hypothetical protein